MKPVIVGGATLYLGDCIDILPTLGKVDAPMSIELANLIISKGS